MPLRLLFAKHALEFPLWNGHDICAHNMMRALKQAGHSVALAAVEQPTERAVRDLHLDWLTKLTASTDHALRLPTLQARFASYFGATTGHMVSLADAARQFDADAVIGVGADVLPYMVATAVPRIWYAGDEWVSHYTSLVTARDIKTWRNIATAVVWGLYQRAFARSLDRIWVVSREEQRQMRRWAGVDHVDALPNGVDVEYFVPHPSRVRPNSAIFWGRLDFIPNLQALQWFCHRVWPQLRARYPDAEFQIIGSSPLEEAARLADVPGVVLSRDVQDLRSAVSQHAVVVMPFHSGGGIKNKLLEAASMGKAIVSTSLACSGLRGEPALIVAKTHQDWIEAISSLWQDTETRDELGRRARQWIVREHRWERTAEEAVHTLCGVLRQSGKDRVGGDARASYNVQPRAVFDTVPLPAVQTDLKPARLRFLFAKHTLAFPRSSGHDIRTYNLMRALRHLACDVALATVEEPSTQALNGLHLNWITSLSRPTVGHVDTTRLSRLQRRFASYFGVSAAHMRALSDAVQEFQADVVIGVGADILPYMALTDVPRVWYAGDEWVSHYSSLARITQASTWRHLITAAIWGTYQRAFADGLERIWVVSSPEQRQMQRWTGNSRVDALPNGVDADYFVPGDDLSQRPNSAIFWGRLDFQPNLQALQWFCGAIWPKLKQRFPDAAFQIIGFNAGDEVRALTAMPGVELSPDVNDLRPLVHEHAVVIMPFQSGGGIKNKLLEAASMGKAIVCTPIARGGLRGEPPVITAGSVQAWVEAISELWSNECTRYTLGRDARAWAVREHSWERTAQDALMTLTARGGQARSL
jgi:glycosyltransferase involved in cell wall biosynthesis